MAQKTVWLPEIGEVVLSKRRGTRNIRLSVSANGQIRVGMPAWVPYSAGISFALSRKDWLIKHKTKHEPQLLKDGDRIGKSYRLRFQKVAETKTSSRIHGAEVIIKTNQLFSEKTVQSKAKVAAERALRREAERLLPARLAELASRHNFKFRSVKIKKMTSRWGSCSSQKVITLNYFLMQLPWELIDHVLIHELVHTKHLNHSASFWAEFETVYPGAKKTRKLIHNYRPVINTLAADMA